MEVMEVLVSSIIRVISYTFDHEKWVRNLNHQLKKLKEARDEVQKSAADARRNGKLIDEDVEIWLTKVNWVLANAEHGLVDNLLRAERKCFLWSHPNCKISYQVSKKAKEDEKAVTELLQKGHFDGISYHPKAEEIFALSVDALKASESRINVFNGIMDVLEDDNISLIGVHGMAGIGKSRLIKEVAAKVKEDMLFDAVVSVVVAKAPENKKIQDHIAEQLGFGFYVLEEDRRACQVFLEMKRMKKILVILDDIWVRLDFDSIGIPYGHHHKGCKILLASRFPHLLYGMNTQRTFSVGTLKPEAAWDLFKKISGDGVESPKLQSTAVKVAEECGGLPIAISAVARALRNKSSVEWRAALKTLKMSSKNKTAVEVLQSTVMLSYDHLESQELKSAFLLCYLMGNNGAIEDFLKYSLGLGLFNGIKTIEEARGKALALVLELKESYLLLDSYTNKLFDVHDTVRDFVLSFALEKHRLFVAEDKDAVKDWSEGKKIEDSIVIVWQNAYVGKLPSWLNCPRLKFFCLGCKNPFSQIPDGFFKETQELKVLHLKNVIFSTLPSSIRVLANLNTLCLHDCLLEDIAIIGELWKLEILSLSGSDIEKLPREIGNLTRLKLLDLNNCSRLQHIPPHTLSSLSSLEELSMRKSFREWAIDGDGGKASLAELKELSHLTCLDIHIPDLKMVPKDMFFGRLSRYRIVIGKAREGSTNHKYESSRTVILDIGEENSYHLGDGFKELLNQTEELNIQSKEDLSCIFEGQSFQHLKNLHLEHSRGIQYLVNTMDWTHREAFPNLESLFLLDVYDFKKICHGAPKVKVFDRLKILKVVWCDTLEMLFSLSILRKLLQLQEIEVVDCRNIVELVAEDREELEENSITCDIRSLKLQGLPKLTSFSMQQSTNALPRTSEALFNEKIMFSSLEVLQLSNIHIERIWLNQLATTSCCGQNLRSLIIEDCRNLKYLVSHPVAGCLVQLKRLQIIGCSSMVEIIEAEEKPKEIREAKILFPQLTSLRMENLPMLRGFNFGNSIIEFPNLKEVIVESCPNLKIFSHGVLTPKLRNIEISGGAKARRLLTIDLNAAIQQFYEEQRIGMDETESKVKLKINAGASGTQRDEAAGWKAIRSGKNVSSPATRHKSDQRLVPEEADVIDEAKVISGPASKLESPSPLTVDVEVTRETLTTPVEKALSTAETLPSPSLTAENPDTIPDESEGASSIHEIENNAAQKDHEILEVTENVRQSREPVSTLTLSMPGDRAIIEPLASIPPPKDDEVSESYETGVAAITTIDQCVSKILECMSTDTIRRIAVHGVCGVGKSSVLRALANNLKTKREFDLIIWVTVSKYCNPKRIQDQIVRQLSPASSNAEPFQVLKGKKFLLLLDDVWEQIDLQKMGIPDPSMMIVATREWKVCDEMEDITVVNVKTISKEEAWKLFRKQVGGVGDLPSIQHFAQGIVEMCCGLPLLIFVTGRALADEKNVSVWEDAFNEFSVPGRDIKSRMEDLIQLLKFSFDRLRSRSLKSCFLHCALFSEDQEIRIDKFIEYCIQEGLVDGSWSDVYERGRAIVDALLSALLLETTDDGLSIRMPDVMRDLALGILSSDTGGLQSLLTTYSKPLKPENRSSSTGITDGHRFLCRVAAGLTEPPAEVEWGKSKMMFLMDNKLSTLPEKPNCPELEILLLQRNYQLRVIPDLFFDNMPSLKVLNLSKTRIKYLPKSISDLKRLEKLLLHDCERLVKLPSEVGFLELLQILDLGGTEITELPKEIAKLYSLTHLEVSLYGSSTNSEHVKLPRQFISRLKALETLRINVYPGDSWWNNSVRFITKELSNLKKLTSLSFYFPEVKFLELFLRKNASWKKGRLTEFKLVVGRDIKFNASRVPQSVQLNYGLISGGCLRFVNSEKIPDAIVEVLARCTAFYLDHHLDILRLSDFGIGNINKLKYCIISECPHLETIIDSNEGAEVVFPCLEHLSIHYSWRLECIWKGVIPEGSFAALRNLALRACPKLTYVFKSSMLQFISNLEKLQVDDCEAIETIVSSEEATESHSISLKSLTLQYLPELVHIWEGAQTKLLFEYITVYDCPQLKQICKDSELKQTLKEIRAEKDCRDDLVGSDFKGTFTSILEGDVHFY